MNFVGKVFCLAKTGDHQFVLLLFSQKTQAAQKLGFSKGFDSNQPRQKTNQTIKKRFLLMNYAVSILNDGGVLTFTKKATSRKL